MCFSFLAPATRGKRNLFGSGRKLGRMRLSLPIDVSSLETETISDPAYSKAVTKIRSLSVPVPKSVSDAEEVKVSYIHWPRKKTPGSKTSLPLVLVHGFDSSCLEYRRLGPKLSALGIDVYAVDLLGWGFTELENVVDFSAAAKVETLRRFWSAVDKCNKGGDCVIAGASLGGAAAIEFAAAASAIETNDASENVGGSVKGMVLIDAQGFVDGVGPMSLLPEPLAKVGIKVLQSVPLRSSANKMSYYRPDVFATDDALKIGRMHTLRQGWDDAMFNFMRSGGFTPSSKLAQCSIPTLVLWGRQDGILDGEEFANKFVEELPNASLTWVEECGHVPHLEQPDKTAKIIADFLLSADFEDS